MRQNTTQTKYEHIYTNRNKKEKQYSHVKSRQESKSTILLRNIYCEVNLYILNYITYNFCLYISKGMWLSTIIPIWLISVLQINAILKDKRDLFSSTSDSQCKERPSDISMLYASGSWAAAASAV